jgi:hypothetical protein
MAGQNNLAPDRAGELTKGVRDGIDFKKLAAKMELDNVLNCRQLKTNIGKGNSNVR